MSCRFFVASFLVLSVGVSAAARSPAPAKTTASRSALTPGEARASGAFEAAKKTGGPALYAFLKPMPKGADLHMHLSGAIYAETFLREGVQQGLCVDVAKLAFAPAPKNGRCPDGQIIAKDAVKDQQLYDKLINSFSMRSFVPSQGYSGHDHFFTTFDRFRGLDGVAGEWLDEVATRAAAQNEQYLEIMQTPSFNHAFAAIGKAPWPAEFNDANHMTVLAKYRDELLANGLREDVAVDQSELSSTLAQRSSIENCGPDVADGISRKSMSGCTIKIYFLYQVLRGFPPAQVFAQTLLGFELASAHPEQVVGINFVRAEDRRDAMAEYHTEMLMLDYLHSVYPKVHISLHAGELAPGLVPPDGMSFHIREAVELGHAERIGHGVDVLYEERPAELLKEMAAKHVDVEINLISNLGILGVTGKEHPLAAYRAAHVPFSLSTDDEGVSRTDLTHNYVQAALDQGLSYADLKLSARNSLEHSFLPGASLWTTPDNYTHVVPACAGVIGANHTMTVACKNLLNGSERAAQQWELERRFAEFEAGIQ